MQDRGRLKTNPSWKWGPRPAGENLGTRREDPALRWSQQMLRVYFWTQLANSVAWAERCEIFLLNPPNCDRNGGKLTPLQLKVTLDRNFTGFTFNNRIFDGCIVIPAASCMSMDVCDNLTALVVFFHLEHLRSICKDRSCIWKVRKCVTYYCLCFVALASFILDKLNVLGSKHV